MPKKLRTFDYPRHFKVRLVSTNGGMKWKNSRVNVSNSLGREFIGLEEMEDGIFDVYFCDFLIGRFVEKENRIKEIIKRELTSSTIARSKCYPCT